MPLAAPQNFTAVTGTYYGEINLSWDAVIDAVQYNVYRRRTAVGGTYAFVGITTEITLTLEGMAGDTSYDFVAAAVDVDGLQGALSAPATATTLGAGDAPPRAPAGLSVRSGHEQNVLSWDSGAADVFAWRVKRSTDQGGPYTTIPGVEMWGEPRYTDTGLTNETTYYYVVDAFNLLWSADSAEIAGTPRETITRVVRSLVRRRR